MENTVESEAAWLLSLSPASRAAFLAALSHNLTIGIRVLCHSAGNASEGLEQVRLLNEAHHRVASYLSHYHAGDEDPGWTKVVVECVLQSGDKMVHEQAAQAWSYAKGSMPSENAP